MKAKTRKIVSLVLAAAMAFSSLTFTGAAPSVDNTVNADLAASSYTPGTDDAAGAVYDDGVKIIDNDAFTMTSTVVRLTVNSKGYITHEKDASGTDDYAADEKVALPDELAVPNEDTSLNFSGSQKVRKMFEIVPKKSGTLSIKAKLDAKKAAALYDVDTMTIIAAKHTDVSEAYDSYELTAPVEANKKYCFGGIGTCLRVYGVSLSEGSVSPSEPTTSEPTTEGSEPTTAATPSGEEKVVAEGTGAVGSAADTSTNTWFAIDASKDALLKPADGQTLTITAVVKLATLPTKSGELVILSESKSADTAIGIRSTGSGKETAALKNGTAAANGTYVVGDNTIIFTVKADGNYTVSINGEVTSDKVDPINGVGFIKLGSKGSAVAMDLVSSSYKITEAGGTTPVETTTAVAPAETTTAVAPAETTTETPVETTTETPVVGGDVSVDDGTAGDAKEGIEYKVENGVYTINDSGTNSGTYTFAVTGANSGVVTVSGDFTLGSEDNSYNVVELLNSADTSIAAIRADGTNLSLRIGSDVVGATGATVVAGGSYKYTFTLDTATKEIGLDVTSAGSPAAIALADAAVKGTIAGDADVAKVKYQTKGTNKGGGTTYVSFTKPEVTVAGGSTPPVVEEGIALTADEISVAENGEQEVAINLTGVDAAHPVNNVDFWVKYDPATAVVTKAVGIASWVGDATVDADLNDTVNYAITSAHVAADPVHYTQDMVDKGLTAYEAGIIHFAFVNGNTADPSLGAFTADRKVVTLTFKGVAEGSADVKILDASVCSTPDEQGGVAYDVKVTDGKVTVTAGSAPDDSTTTTEATTTTEPTTTTTTEITTVDDQIYGDVVDAEPGQSVVMNIRLSKLSDDHAVNNGTFWIEYAPEKVVATKLEVLGTDGVSFTEIPIDYLLTDANVANGDKYTLDEVKKGMSPATAGKLKAAFYIDKVPADDTNVIDDDDVIPAGTAGAVVAKVTFTVDASVKAETIPVNITVVDFAGVPAVDGSGYDDVDIKDGQGFINVKDVIAPDESTTESTEASTESTEASTESTEASTESTESTQASTESTEASTESTEASTESTEASTEASTTTQTPVTPEDTTTTQTPVTPDNPSETTTSASRPSGGGSGGGGGSRHYYETTTVSEGTTEEGTEAVTSAEPGEEEGNKEIAFYSEDGYHFAYMVGYNDGTFGPNKNITRAEIAAVFARLMTGEIRVNGGSASYSDVTGDEWFADYVGYLEDLNVIAGYNDGTFGPNKPITRAEFATLLAKFAKTSGSGNATFSDTEGHWAASSIANAVAAGWMSGYPDGTFKPNAYITRAELVSAINRATGRTADVTAVADVSFSDVPSGAWYEADVAEAVTEHWYTGHEKWYLSKAEYEEAVAPAEEETSEETTEAAEEGSESTTEAAEEGSESTTEAAEGTTEAAEETTEATTEA